jgi:hypothetical protein
MDKCQNIIIPSCLNHYIGDDTIIEYCDHINIHHFLHNIEKKMSSVTDENEFDSLETILICYTMRYATIYRMCVKQINTSSMTPMTPYIFYIPLDEIHNYHIDHGHILAYFESIVNSIYTLKKYNNRTCASEYITIFRNHVRKYAQICIYQDKSY